MLTTKNQAVMGLRDATTPQPAPPIILFSQTANGGGDVDDDDDEKRGSFLPCFLVSLSRSLRKQKKEKKTLVASFASAL